MAEDIGVVTYYSLASGVLSGKYRSTDDLGKSARGQGVAKYLDARGVRILDALDAVSAGRGAQPADVALAWLMARKGVTAPIASATRRTHEIGSASCRGSVGQSGEISVVGVSLKKKHK